MTWRTAASKARRGLVARSLTSLAPTTRQRFVLELVRVAGAVSPPEARGELHRALALQAASWPTTEKIDEIHTAGLYGAIRDTAHVEGAIVECGVGHGRSLVSLARAAELFCPHKVVIGFDSFAGFPPAVAADLGGRHETLGTAPSGWKDTSVRLVEEMLDAPATVIRGFFEDTLTASAPPAISVLHVDCDMYESTKTVLRACLPRMKRGGVIIFDEYHIDRWPGATSAIDEMVGAVDITWEPTLARFVSRSC